MLQLVKQEPEVKQLVLISKQNFDEKALHCPSFLVGFLTVHALDSSDENSGHSHEPVDDVQQHALHLSRDVSDDLEACLAVRICGF